MFSNLTGYRTIIVMVLGLVAAFLQSRGILLPESDQGAIATAIISIVGIIMRLFTKTPAGTKIVPPTVMIILGLYFIGGLSACASKIPTGQPGLSPREVAQQVDTLWVATELGVVTALQSPLLADKPDVKKQIGAASDTAAASIDSFHEQAGNCLRDPKTNLVGDAPGKICDTSAMVTLSNQAMALIGKVTGLLAAFGFHVNIPQGT